ncbi:hypothetical protein APSETT445_006664 [Aspergillus pseudonomiae]
MKAARFYAAGDIRIEEVNAPEASDEKALVQVEWCGICGSDLNEYIHGLSGGGGGFSEKVAVPPAMLHPIPDHTDMATATLIEPLAVAWHGVRCSGVQDFKGLPVLVVGGGPVGVATVFVLRAWGADTIYVSETARRRREFLQDLVQATFDPMEVNVGSQCKTLTNGSGVGMVFDCAGSQQGLEAASDGLRFHGLYINLAVPKSPISLPVGYFMFKELTYKAFLAYDNADFKATVAAFVEGVERMITRRIALEDLVDKGFKTLLQNADEHIKIVATAGELPPVKSTL